jgi:hypothetical protein
MTRELKDFWVNGLGFFLEDAQIYEIALAGREYQRGGWLAGSIREL